MRSMIQSSRVWLMVIPTLILALLACSLTLPSPPKAPLPSFVPSVNDANAFEQTFAQAANQAAQTGQFSATITEQQLSSWLNLRGAGYAKQQGYDLPVKDMQAVLDGGKVTFYGILSQTNVPDTPFQAIFTPTVDANGALAVAVQSGQVGVVSVPSSLLTQINQAIKDALTSQLSQIKGKYRITALTIAGGKLTISGQIVR